MHFRGKKKKKKPELAGVEIQPPVNQENFLIIQGLKGEQGTLGGYPSP